MFVPSYHEQSFYFCCAVFWVCVLYTSKDGILAMKYDIKSGGFDFW